MVHSDSIVDGKDAAERYEVRRLLPAGRGLPPAPPVRMEVATFPHAGDASIAALLRERVHAGREEAATRASKRKAESAVSTASKEPVVEPAGQAVAQEADKRGDLEYRRSCGVRYQEEQLYQGGEDEQKNEQLAESMEERVGWMLM